MSRGQRKRGKRKVRTTGEKPLTRVDLGEGTELRARTGGGGGTAGKKVVAKGQRQEKTKVEENGQGIQPSRYDYRGILPNKDGETLGDDHMTGEEGKKRSGLRGRPILGKVEGRRHKRRGEVSRGKGGPGKGSNR